jgi:hypothetical protein
MGSGDHYTDIQDVLNPNIIRSVPNKGWEGNIMSGGSFVEPKNFDEIIAYQANPL